MLFRSQNYRDELDWEEGRRYSLKRALNNVGFQKAIRSKFWNKYIEEFIIKKVAKS